MSKKKDAEKAVVYQRIDVGFDPSDPMPTLLADGKIAYDDWLKWHNTTLGALDYRVTKENGIRAYLPFGAQDQLEFYDKRGKLLVRRDYRYRKEMNWTTLEAECAEKGVDLKNHWFYHQALEFDYYPK